jgi:hypothetical protein
MNMSGSSPPMHGLEDLRQRLWQELAQCTIDKAHPWRKPVLATACEPGGADARTVVLREVDASHETLIFFTDARAGKVAQILAQPQGTMVMWSAELGWQLRLKVALSLHTDGLAVTSRWARLQHSRAAQDYLSPLKPGQALAPLAHPVTEASTASAPGEQRHHFAVVQARVLAMDWLALRPEGHQRAVWDAEGARWVQP